MGNDIIVVVIAGLLLVICFMALALGSVKEERDKYRDNHLTFLSKESMKVGDLVWVMFGGVVYEVELTVVVLKTSLWNAEFTYWIDENPHNPKLRSTLMESEVFPTKQLLLDSL
jgi:hypothetical protein